jgi:hypothetical protein
MFTKTDLAKYENTFGMQPHTVSLGAQKNFAIFASAIDEKWKKNEKQYNELYFKHLVAKAVIFRFLDLSIMREDWYGGYKANIVTYSLAKLIHMISSMGKCLDLDQIWLEQKLSPPLKTQLLAIAKLVNEQIQKTPNEVTNVTEWCKKEMCWKFIQEMPITLGKDLLSVLKDTEDAVDDKKDAEKKQIVDNGIIVQKNALEKGAEYWKQIASYGMKHSLLSSKEMGILEIACEIPLKIPSEKQSEVLLQIEKKVKNEGFFSKES